MSQSSSIAVALVHYPTLNRKGETSATSITTLDIHDFARTCAFYGVEPVYLVHPAAAMQALVHDVCTYWQDGAAAERNLGRKSVLESVRAVDSLETILQQYDYQLWYTSARCGESEVDVSKLREIEGKHLIVFGTGHGLDEENMPKANGWLSGIAGMGKVRHLSVRAALAIYLDRLFR